ncbi:hypothetical protein B0H13DRAFT_2368081 [Mycena leptocephala]|nr:hypothetical protein B0H13DRAFT_2368081 [Mycena leptocephala]
MGPLSATRFADLGPRCYEDLMDLSPINHENCLTHTSLANGMEKLVEAHKKWIRGDKIENKEIIELGVSVFPDDTKGMKSSSETRFSTSHIQAKSVHTCIPGIMKCIDTGTVKFSIDATKKLLPFVSDDPVNW